MPPVNQASLGDLGWVLLEGSKEPPSQSSGRAKVSDYRGKVLVLDFYATWCAPCRESIPELIELQRRYEAQGLEIVGLNVGGADDRVKVAAFAHELGINYSLGFPDQALSNLLLADDASIPQTYVFSRDGKLVKRFMGYGELAQGKLEEVIKTQAADNANSNGDGAQR